VLLDPSQASQIIINFVVNARDATDGKGTIRITTQGRWSGQERWVRLSVADDGKGMDEETRARVFEPFFTTKGEGTGLGLSTVYGIVEQNGGRIAVESSRGQGTVFHVDLPDGGRIADSAGGLVGAGANAAGDALEAGEGVAEDAGKAVKGLGGRLLGDD